MRSQASGMTAQPDPSLHNLARVYAAFPNFSTLFFADPVLMLCTPVA